MEAPPAGLQVGNIDSQLSTSYLVAAAGSGWSVGLRVDHKRNTIIICKRHLRKRGASEERSGGKDGGNTTVTACRKPTPTLRSFPAFRTTTRPDYM